MPDAHGMGGDAFGRFGGVSRDLSELKRMRDQSGPDSVAERLFRAAWCRLGAGADPGAVCRDTVADALAATRLAGIDAALLAELGVGAAERGAILRRAFDDAAGTLDPSVSRLLEPHLGAVRDRDAETAPPFVQMLIDQPRAGATSPGKPRLALEPVESHGDHCLVVAVLGALLAMHDAGADPARAFLAGLAHHLHNARLPDTGFAGEVMLGDALEPIMRRLTGAELDTLPEAPRLRVADALRLVGDADSADGRAFNAADVIDRVLQARHHARAAAFTVDQALDDLQLVHEGPLQRFHLQVLSALELV